MKTPAERKRDERKRKRESGLVLKQLWVPEAAWPLISDLATAEEEASVFEVHTKGGSYDSSDTYDDGIHADFVYEFANELFEESLARGQIAFGTPEMGQNFARHVIRAMIKIYSDKRKPHPETVRMYEEE